MKNKKENSSIIDYLSFTGLIQIILIVIKVCGGLKDWPITAILLPSIVALVTFFICIAVAFVLICMGLITMKKNNKE